MQVLNPGKREGEKNLPVCRRAKGLKQEGSQTATRLPLTEKDNKLEVGRRGDEEEVEEC